MTTRIHYAGESIDVTEPIENVALKIEAQLEAGHTGGFAVLTRESGEKVRLLISSGVPIKLESPAAYDLDKSFG